jgi:ribose-phosphate pyrophosphokinase
MSDYKIFSINNLSLSTKIADALGTKLGKIKVDTFSDGEMSPQFQESVRGHKVFLICTTSNPEEILKLLLTLDAAKRASASEVIAILPYYGYSRQDRKEGPRGAVGARLISDIIQTAGANRLICMDLHADQIQGFFNGPVNLVPGYVAYRDFFKSLPKGKYTICSPDAGGVKRANKFYQHFLKEHPDTTFAMLSKLRDKPNSIERMDLIGDIAGREVIIIDDMIDTGGTLVKAAELLKQGGANSVSACITHGVLSGAGHERIASSNHLDKLIITDSIDQQWNPKIEVVSCAPAIAATVNAITSSTSLEDALEKLIS